MRLRGVKGTPSTDMDLGQAFEAPLAWLLAETTAEDFITAGEGTVWRGTFEFRATRDVLASTLFLAEVDCSSVDTGTNPLELLRDHLVTATGWLAWCRSRLDGLQLAMATPEIRLATDAWQWLQRGRLLAGPGLDDVTCGDDACLASGPAYCLGLPRARRIVDACLSGGV